MADPQQVAIGLGSNLGNREHLIHDAVELLCASAISAPQLSSLIPTVALDCEPDAPDFLNAVLTGVTDVLPADLLAACHDIEQRLGRPPRSERGVGVYTSRSIDIDVLVMGMIVDPEGPPILPHPELRARDFVLRPFAEIAPEWTLPPDGATVQSCLDKLVGGG